MRKVGHPDMKLNKYVGGSIAALATVAVVAGSALPAHADPVRPYAATGSDTTQDVWNGLTNDGGPLGTIASYDAFDGANETRLINSKTNGVWFTRPKGSSNGQRALSAVWDPANHTWSGVLLGQNGAEEVDFARSSDGPSSSAPGSDLTFMPFGRDAISIAYNTSTGLPAGLNLSSSQIEELFTGVNDTTNDAPGTTTNAVVEINAGVPTINGITVQPKVPQQGSGTRSFSQNAFIGTAALASYISDPALPGGLPENKGTAIPNGGDLIAFSAAQWIAQHNNIPGVANTTTANHSIALINGLTPATGTTTLAPGSLYGAKVGANYSTVPVPGKGVYNRDVYNVIPSTFRSAPTSKQSNLVGMLTTGLNGTAAKGIVNKYGFGTLSYGTNSANFKLSGWRH